MKIKFIYTIRSRKISDIYLAFSMSNLKDTIYDFPYLFGRQFYYANKIYKEILTLKDQILINEVILYNNKNSIIDNYLYKFKFILPENKIYLNRVKNAVFKKINDNEEIIKTKMMNILGFKMPQNILILLTLNENNNSLICNTIFFDNNTITIALAASKNNKINKENISYAILYEIIYQIILKQKFSKKINDPQSFCDITAKQFIINLSPGLSILKNDYIKTKKNLQILNLQQKYYSKHNNTNIFEYMKIK